MTRETVLGAGGVQSGWAIWSEGMARPAKEVALETNEPQLTIRASEAPEVSLLRARFELLERENDLLRQRLAIADKQVEVKDSQINDFKAITENLTRQNQVLLMLAQGVSIERILKGGGEEIEVRPSHYESEDGSSPRISHSWESKKKLRETITSRIEQLLNAGVSQQQIADTLNKEGVPTLSGTGSWNRRKVGKMVSVSIRTI